MFLITETPSEPAMSCPARLLKLPFTADTATRIIPTVAIVIVRIFCKVAAAFTPKILIPVISAVAITATISQVA